MRIFRDDVYVFSLARSCPGKIIACRAADGDASVGKNITEVLSLDRSDVEHVKKNNDLEEYRSVCLSCYPKGKHKAVAFFDFLSYSSSLCVAVVFDFDPAPAAIAMSRLGYRNARLAPSLECLCGEDDILALDVHKAFTYISYVYGCIAPLSSLRAGRVPENPEMLRSYVDCIADLVGIDVEYFTERKFDFAEEEKVIFAGGFLLATIIVSAMLARRYASDRRLDVSALQGKNMLLLTLGFDGYTDALKAPLEFLSGVAFGYGIYFDGGKSGDKVRITFMPTYVDVGFVGVKERDDYPLYSELYRLEKK